MLDLWRNRPIGTRYSPGPRCSPNKTRGGSTLLSPWASARRWVTSFTSSVSCLLLSLESRRSWDKFTWFWGKTHTSPPVKRDDGTGAGSIRLHSIKGQCVRLPTFDSWPPGPKSTHCTFNSHQPEQPEYLVPFLRWQISILKEPNKHKQNNTHQDKHITLFVLFARWRRGNSWSGILNK